MKQIKLFATVAVLVAVVPSTTVLASNVDVISPDQTENFTEADWELFSDNLIAALNSDHPGLQESALRHAIQYKENVQLRGAAVTMMKLYRNNDNPNMKRLAVVALASLDSPLVDGYLTRASAFEADEVVKKTIDAALAAS